MPNNLKVLKELAETLEENKATIFVQNIEPKEGIAYVGPRGFKGERGVKGAKGERGESGRKGDSGAMGLQGIAGKDGKDGKDATLNKQELIDIAEHEIKSHEDAFDHKLIHDSHIVGTVQVDESTIGKDKVLTYDGKKLVYKKIPKKKESASGGVPTVGTRYRLITTTESITIDPHHEIIHADASSGDVTLTFYPAATNDGRHVYIKRIDDASSNDVTFATPNGETIDFATLHMLVNQGSGAEVYSDGVNFFIKHS